MSIRSLYAVLISLRNPTMKDKVCNHEDYDKIKCTRWYIEPTEDYTAADLL